MCFKISQHLPYVSVFVVFWQAEVDADDLQVLHAAHNLLELLDQATEEQLPGGVYPSCKVIIIPQAGAPQGRALVNVTPGGVIRHTA